MRRKMHAREKPFSQNINFELSYGDIVPELTTADSVKIGVARTWLGPILVAATARGLRAVLFGSTYRSLETDFLRRYPNTPLIRGKAAHQELTDHIGQLIDVSGASLTVDLDLQGSDFEKRVWLAIRAVPIGATASYTEIARAVGPDATAQNVASACATNPLAVIIPCHRIVRKDGTLAGYRWGIVRKRSLLVREQAIPVLKSRQRQLMFFNLDEKTITNASSADSALSYSGWRG